MAKGYVQKPGVDYDEMLTPVAQIETIQILLVLAREILLENTPS